MQSGARATRATPRSSGSELSAYPEAENHARGVVGLVVAPGEVLEVRLQQIEPGARLESQQDPDHAIARRTLEREQRAAAQHEARQRRELPITRPVLTPRAVERLAPRVVVAVKERARLRVVAAVRQDPEILAEVL